MIPRTLTQPLLEASRKHPVVAVTGPRQSGKSTLVKAAFPAKPYVTLEDLDTREYAKTDPRGFLSDYPKGAILDEVQRVPALFSYIQTVVDVKQKAGMFILTGSQQFLLMENLSQTLAGRVRIFNLLPYSLEELKKAKLPGAASLDRLLYTGMYPRLYDKRITPHDWYPDYVRTYVERDVRLIKEISDLSTFQKFLKMCAARTGQLLNLSSLGLDCGISHNTAKAWVSVLEASFIVHLLRPHHRNFNKRMVKMPKLYFYDTGLACSLLEIQSEDQLKTHPLRGNLFETAVIAELIKASFNRGHPSRCYFWRDKTGHEVDCIVEKADALIPIEIKATQTITPDLFGGLNYWKALAKQRSSKACLVHAGAMRQARKEALVVGWRDMKEILSEF